MEAYLQGKAMQSFNAPPAELVYGQQPQLFRDFWEQFFGPRRRGR